MEQETAKQILDKFATGVVPVDAVFIKDGTAQVNQQKVRHYEPQGYTDDLVLWLPPKNFLRIEFEDEPTKNHRYILEIESAAKTLGFDYCITGHGGKSDYFNMVVKGIPLGQDNKDAKLLLIDMLLPSVAKDQLDRTNLGWTLSPVIGHPHWKPKYDGEVHKLLRGKNPVEHDNEYPKELLKQIKKAKIWKRKYATKIKQTSSWVEDFLMNYCCNNQLPGGSRHFVIEKNLAAFLMFRPDKEEIKKRYYAIQKRTTNTMRTWEAAILKGDFADVSAGELAKFIKDCGIPYDIPIPKQIIKYEHLEEAVDKITSYIDYFDLSNQFHQIQPFFYDKAKMWWLWDCNTKSWSMMDEIDLMNRIDDSLNRPETINTTVKNEIIESLKRIGRRKIPKDIPLTMVQFKNKLFDVKTGEIVESNPKLFTTNPIPWEVGETSDTPTIDKIFKEWVGEKYIDTLYEIIAYCCLKDYPIHLILCLIGCGRNGKSRFMALLTKFVGKENVCSTELDTLIDSRFESFKLFKKLVCTMGETNFGLLSKTSLLKKLCGQDMIGFEYKNKLPFDDYNYAKIVISSNSLPSSIDTSEGFYRRWLIIDFPNIFPEGKDILNTIPEKEYNNLAKKVIEVLPKLLEDGKFTNQGSVKQREDKYISASNPLSFFIKEHCFKDDDFFMRHSELYLAYIKYLLNQKRRKISRKEFKNVLDEEGLDVVKTSKKVGDDFVNGYFIEGIKLKEGDIKEKEIEEEVVEQQFDDKLITYQKCMIEDCTIYEINLDMGNKPLCKGHWLQYAKK